MNVKRIRLQYEEEQAVHLSVIQMLYNILVNEAGAREDEREYFTDYMKRDNPMEYRFRGIFGTGGKFHVRRTPGKGITYDISYYPEDDNKEGFFESERLRIQAILDKYQKIWYGTEEERKERFIAIGKISQEK